MRYADRPSRAGRRLRLSLRVLKGPNALDVAQLDRQNHDLEQGPDSEICNIENNLNNV